MNKEESRIFFREKNARRKAEKQIKPAKKLHAERKWRRSLLNGAFGNKEEQDVAACTSVD